MRWKTLDWLLRIPFSRCNQLPALRCMPEQVPVKVDASTSIYSPFHVSSCLQNKQHANKQFVQLFGLVSQHRRIRDTEALGRTPARLTMLDLADFDIVLSNFMAYHG